MGTIVFDFDSTLIPHESLELALARSPGVGADELDAIEAITRRGMEGELDFRSSLEARLEIARPTSDGLSALGIELAGGLTDGAAALVHDLIDAGHDVWIVSGAFRETLLPVGRALGIADARVQGVRALWDDDGAYAGLAPDNAFSSSKVEGVRQLAPDWSAPSIGVGDGATDLALFRAGLVTHFIGYVQHTERKAVTTASVPLAGNMDELRILIGELLDNLPT